MKRQRLLERPPTASEARDWYADGWIDEEGLDQLLETAMETYGGDGEKQFREVDGIETTKEKAEKIEHLSSRANEKTHGRNSRSSFDQSDLLFIGLAGFLIGVLLTIAVLIAFPEFAIELLNLEATPDREPIPL